MHRRAAYSYAPAAPHPVSQARQRPPGGGCGDRPTFRGTASSARLSQSAVSKWVGTVVGTSSSDASSTGARSGAVMQSRGVGIARPASYDVAIKICLALGPGVPFFGKSPLSPKLAESLGAG